VKNPENEVSVDDLPRHYTAAGIYAKEWMGRPGQSISQHNHNYDHLSYLSIGEVVVEVEGKKATFTGPCALLIEAGKAHKVTAVTNCLWLCIHHIPKDLQDAETIETHLISERVQ
jgi:quercetin dioxygenase-like cupin family protein